MDHRDTTAIAVPEGSKSRPVASLPSAWYYDETHFRRELEGIWYRQWLCVGRSSALAGPRAFQVYEIGNQQVLVLRDDDGVVRAFHNTCRHRGAQLCREKSGKLRRRITCPYHAWSFDLNGALAAVPTHGRPASIDAQDHGLYAVKVQLWGGFIFISLAEDDAPPLFPFFDEDRNRLANWPLDDLVVAHSATRHVDCNWKIIWENYSECLHCPGVHPGLARIMPIYGRGILAEEDDPNWQRNAASTDPKHKGGLADGARTWSLDGLSSGHEFNTLDDADRLAGASFVTALPSFYIAAHVDYVRAVRLRPLGPTTTEWTTEWLLPQAALEDPTFSSNNIVQFGLEFMGEDAEVCEVNQRGVTCLRHRQGVLMPEEHHVARLHGWLNTVLNPD
jgi:Rieske 2Fe-2S family protein